LHKFLLAFTLTFIITFLSLFSPSYSYNYLSGIFSKSGGYWPDPSSGTAQALSETLEFDVELFAAYTLDWQERVLVIGEQSSALLRSAHRAVQCSDRCGAVNACHATIIACSCHLTVQSLTPFLPKKQIKQHLAQILKNITRDTVTPAPTFRRRGKSTSEVLPSTTR
jgi:hypothetical protein